MPALTVRNKGLAIFIELETGTKPVVTTGGFKFDLADGGESPDTQIAEYKYRYSNSLVQKVYELNIAYSQAQTRVARKNQSVEGT